jgi:hypothetical protein
LEGNHDLHKKKPCNKQIAKKQWMTQKKYKWHNGSAPLNDIHKDDKY